MERVVRDGKVAVIYSPGFGAGWYSWNDRKELLFDPEIVRCVEAGDSEGALARAKAIEPSGYFGGLRGLSVQWLDEGTVFRISEYDGSEEIVTNTDDNWVTA